MRRTQWRKKHLSVSIIVLILAAVMVIMVINSGTDDEEVLHSPLWHQRNLRDDKLMMETVWRAQGPLQADHPDLLRLLRERLFSDTPPGFFLEAGALDGEFISNTLYLEQQLGWTGLLVEADPVRSTGNLAGVSSPAGGRMGVKVREMVQCFPLISYLLALNTTTVHYLSLDVEGAEADILITLPWEKLDVTVWSIEHRDTNTKFRELYQEATEDPLPKNLQEENTKEAHEENEKPSPHEVVKVRKKVVVYVNAHDPAGGKDDYFVRFMTERGYMLYYYWDGDYTFIKKNSSICQRHCPIL
ncbi:Star-like 13 [Homarus americanus]|uniref:Star-like 13 n=1 Tax=Homarus americanus TaxID=6706 RepID=A0A8J5K1W7_HOMAM|nr:Star-like 13 [Homarus americanus]